MSLYEQIAIKIVNKCLNVKDGEQVLISGGIHQYELLSKIALHTKIAGAHPTISVINDELYIRTMTEVDESVLLRDPTEHDKYIAGLYDAAIHIDSMVDQSKLQKISSELISKIGTKDHILRDIKYDAKRRTIAMSWPTKERADRAGLTEQEMADLFWKALTINLDEMDVLNKKLEAIYEKGSKVVITSEKGSNITFSIEDRRVMVDGGHYADGMVEEGDRIKNLPCGEVYTTALESTPQGTAIFDEVFLKGMCIKNLKCEFKGGKLIKSSADENHDAFLELWDTATGDKDQIAEFAIGTNPEITKPVGDSLFDEKIFGSVHLAIGENKFFGGTSHASIHWDFVIQKPTVKIDDVLVLKDGIFQI